MALLRFSALRMYSHLTCRSMVDLQCASPVPFPPPVHLMPLQLIWQYRWCPAAQRMWKWRKCPLLPPPPLHMPRGLLAPHPPSQRFLPPPMPQLVVLTMATLQPQGQLLECLMRIGTHWTPLLRRWPQARPPSTNSPSLLAEVNRLLLPPPPRQRFLGRPNHSSK